jgi:hypothetical protein
MLGRSNEGDEVKEMGNIMCQRSDTNRILVGKSEVKRQLPRPNYRLHGIVCRGKTGLK